MIEVPFAEYSVDDPWAVPERCRPVTMRRATDGGTARLPTTAALYFDREALNVVFSAEDDHVVATMYEHDAPLYREDVMEVFLAPSSIEEYFEIEVSPLGTIFDARIESPDGVRATMKTDLAWTCADLFFALRREEQRLEVALRIPFAALSVATPETGGEWRANLFRIDRHPEHGDEFLAWSPTLKTPPDFHVAAAFGTLRFVR